MPDRRVSVTLDADTSAYNRAILASAATTKAFSREAAGSDSNLAAFDKTAGGSSREIDRLSGRLRLFVDIAATVGPSLIPIGAVGIPAVTGLASAFGMAAVGAGTAVLAFQGVGDALGAMNKAHLEPTAANLKAADLAMRQLGPDAQALIRHLTGLTDEWHQLRDAAASGIMPGAEKALDSLIERAPQAIKILERVSAVSGNLLAEGGASIASDRWDDFFRFIGSEAPPAIAGLAHATGDLAHAAAELWMAFGPLNADALAWMVTGADSLDRWATGLSKTEGFQEFVAYIRTNGPQVGETLASISLALLAIVEAAAPLGGPVLKVLEAVADVIATIANSPFGPPIMAGFTALSLFNRALAVTESVGKRAWVTNVRGAEGFAAKAGALGPSLGKAVGAMAGISLAASGAADGLGLSNTASLALIGTLGGPWGAAAGAAVGLLMDLTASSGGFEVSVTDLTATLDQQTGAVTRSTEAWVANQLYTQGVLDSANQLGLSLSDVTQAALGNEAAVTRVNDALALQEAAMHDADGRVTVGTETWQKYGEASNLVKDAIGDTNGALTEGQRRVHDIGEAMGAAADGTDTARTALERFADAVTRANRLLSSRAGVRDYEQALDDLTKSLKENGKTLDINGEKGRKNQAALDAIANTALKVAENLKGADRVQFLKQARQDFVDAATKLGMTRQKAVELANQLGLVGRIKAKPEVDVDNSSALRKLDAVRNGIAALHDKTVTITTRAVHMDIRLERGHAGGGLITGPGTGTSDSIPIRASDGEYMVRSKAVDKYGVAMFDRLNAMSYANGGPVTRSGGGAGAGGAGPIGAILQALLTSGFGPGQIRAFQKALDELQRDLAKNKGKWSDELRRQAHDLMKEIRQAEEERHQAVRDAFRSLNLDLQGGAAGIRSELTNLRDSLRATGGVWDDAMQKQADRVLGLAKRYDRQAEALDGQRTLLDQYTEALGSTLDAQRSFADQVAGNFQSDLFGGSLADFFKGGQKDTANAQMFDQVLKQLVGMGLDGSAYQQLAASGNLSLAQQLAASGDVSAFESTLGGRDSAAGRLGGAAGYQAFGAMVDTQTKAVVDQTAVVRASEQHLAAMQTRLDDLVQVLKKTAGPEYFNPGTARKFAVDIGNEVATSLNGVAASASRTWGQRR